MSEFKKGQRVKVEIEGVVRSVHDTGRPGYLHWTDEDGLERVGAFIYSDAPNVKVTLTDPEDWPPQVGDIWEANGKEWFARSNEYGHHEPRRPVILVPETGEWADTGELKALNPVLVRRRNAHPAQPVCVERGEGQ